MISAQNHQRRLSGNKIFFLLAIMILASGCGLFNKTRDSNRGKVLDEQVESNIDTLDISKIPDADISPIKKDPKKIEIEEDFSAYKKESYKIGMLIPFNASDAYYDVNDGSDQKFVNYYAGVKLALEEFQEKGHRFQVNILDSERSPETVESKLTNGALTDSDIIVGPYNRDGLTIAAEYGKKEKTAIISPWLSSTKITDNNPYYIQLRPSLSSHYFKMIDHANQNFDSEEIILVGRNNDADKNRFRYFQKTYSALNNFNNGNELREFFVNDDSLSYADFAFTSVFDGRGKMAIILPNWNYNDEDFIYSVLRRLNIEKGATDLYVYGMPIIYDSDKIDFEFYKNLKLRMCLSEFVDWEDERVKKFMRKFYDNYGDLPTSDAFEGYDMMNFIGTNLIKYGINFQLYLEKDRNRYLQTSYDIQKIFEEDDEKFEKIKYLENRHLDLIQFRGNKFVKID